MYLAGMIDVHRWVNESFPFLRRCCAGLSDKLVHQNLLQTIKAIPNTEDEWLPLSLLGLGRAGQADRVREWIGEC